MTNIQHLFDLTGKTVAITGGAGVLGGEMARMLVAHGANVAILDLAEDSAKALAGELNAAQGRVCAIGVATNVLQRESIEAAAIKVTQAFGPVDILINGAGGNKPDATTSLDLSFFDIPPDAAQWVFNLNFIGTLLPSQVFGRVMAERDSGVILNISSMSAFRALTRIPAYSAAKAAVSNFTGWLAAHMAQEYSANVRVNAIAPGFFITEQNRFLLTKEDGSYTERGQKVIDHTPAGRFGTPDELLGAVLWLVTPASQFVTGAVIPIDGGFNAYSGV
jgi:NAD(P)-dependent dehydrogenase (short-subunit alcohol dehydrogenase family)